MANVDDWLARAAQVTDAGPRGTGIDRIQRQLDAEPGPAIALRQDMRLIMLCAALSALIAFGGTVSLMSGMREAPAATWIATPPAASPFGLLVGQ